MVGRSSRDECGIRKLTIINSGQSGGSKNQLPTDYRPSLFTRYIQAEAVRNSSDIAASRFPSLIIFAKLRRTELREGREYYSKPFNIFEKT